MWVTLNLIPCVTLNRWLTFKHMVDLENHVFEGQSPIQVQPRDHVQGNPHSTVIFYGVNITAGRYFWTNLPPPTHPLLQITGNLLQIAVDDCLLCQAVLKLCKEGCAYWDYRTGRKATQMAFRWTGRKCFSAKKSVWIIIIIINIKTPCLEILEITWSKIQRLRVIGMAEGPVMYNGRSVEGLSLEMEVRQGSC
jgi:hypothetical protein